MGFLLNILIIAIFSSVSCMYSINLVIVNVVRYCILFFKHFVSVLQRKAKHFIAQQFFNISCVHYTKYFIELSNYRKTSFTGWLTQSQLMYNVVLHLIKDQYLWSSFRLDLNS